MVVAFDEAQNTLNMLKGHRTDEKISELFARAQIISDTMEVVLQPMRRVDRQVHRDNPNVNSAEQQCTLHFFTTLTMNSSEDFLVISSRKFRKFDHVVDSVVDKLSTVFRANLPDF